MLTEAAGIPLTIEIDGANRHDSKLVEATLMNMKRLNPPPTEAAPQQRCLDRGYDCDTVRALVAEFGFTAHIRSRGQERAAAIKRDAGQRARRWVVERTHSWINRFRRLLVRWEKRADTYIAMLHLACALITWRAATRLPE